jgi:hypothetical protein
MIVYKFRINFEDPEDVSRDIEIKPGQTFEAFHKAILKSINFDESGEATFYVSDDYWRKGEKIPFEKLAEKKLVSCVDDPHQKFLYEYKSKNTWPLTIELIKIIEGEELNTYPRCVKAVGDAPLQFNLITPILNTDELRDEGALEDDIDDTIFYSSGVENLDGFSEEGDEESEFEEESGDEEESEFEDESYGGQNEEEDY